MFLLIAKNQTIDYFLANEIITLKQSRSPQLLFFEEYLLPLTLEEVTTIVKMQQKLFSTLFPF